MNNRIGRKNETNYATIWPRRHFSKKNNGKYIDRRSNDIITGQKIRNELLKIELSIAYLQLKVNETQNDYLTQMLEFLAGVELKLLLEKIELTQLFKKSRNTSTARVQKASTSNKLLKNLKLLLNILIF